MKAAVLEQYNQPLVIRQLTRPTPQPYEVLVRVVSVGLNPLDIKIQENKAAHAQVKIPAVPGIDVAGIVEETGKNVTSFNVGDKVFGMAGGVAGIQGALAEYMVVDADLLALKPANISFKEAAALPLAFITAWEALVDKAKLQAGSTVLIHGGGGGVGHLAVQLAVAKGATVFATVSDKNSALIKSYGAEPVNYNDISPEQYITEYTGGKGFDVVLDTVGGKVLDDSFKAVKIYTGHVVSILGWSTHSLAPLSFRSGTYSGVFTLYPLISGEGRSHFGYILNKAAELVNAEKLRPFMNEKRYTLDTVNEAYTDMKNKAVEGKTVVDINDAGNQ